LISRWPPASSILRAQSKHHGRWAGLGSRSSPQPSAGGAMCQHAPPLLSALPSDNCGGSKDSERDMDSSNHYLREMLDVNGKAGGDRGDEVMATVCRLGSGPIPTPARRACLCCLTLAACGAAALDPTQEGGEEPTALGGRAN
ncbi:hypothetical protein THAOC_11589, partial [Thalassiosira oceanica]